MNDNLKEFIKKEVVDKSSGKIRIMKVSKPTKEQLDKLDAKIQSGIRANEEMRDRSWKTASENH